MSSRKGTVRKDGIEFLDIWPYRSDEYPFQIFIGARDGGKTYSYLKGLILKYQEDGKPFIYTRRLQSELEECADTRDGKETGNPFSKLTWGGTTGSAPLQERPQASISANGMMQKKGTHIPDRR